MRSDKGGYIWDKVNYNGIIGYVARGDSKEDYIVPVDEEGNGDNNGSGDENIPSKNNKLKWMENKLYVTQYQM